MRVSRICLRYPFVSLSFALRSLGLICTRAISPRIFPLKIVLDRTQFQYLFTLPFRASPAFLSPARIHTEAISPIFSLLKKPSNRAAARENQIPRFDLAFQGPRETPRTTRATVSGFPVHPTRFHRNRWATSRGSIGKRNAQYQRVVRYQ